MSATFSPSDKSKFAWFVGASGLTNLADGISTVAWAWLASLLTRDPVFIALVPVALRSPWFIFALPAGIVTDRTDRRSLILAMDLIRFLAFLGAALAVWQALPLEIAPGHSFADPFLFSMIVLAALVVGAAEVFRDNAAQTMMPAIVDAQALERANGRLWSVELIGNALLGPAVGAFLIALFLPAPFAVNAALFFLALLLMVNVPGTFKPENSTPSHWRTELKEGFTYLQTQPTLKVLAWLTGFWNLFFQMVMIALVLHVQDNLNLGATAYGLILASGAIGGILGGFLGEKIVAALGPGRTAQWMLACSAPSFLAIALAPGAISLAIVLAVFEFTGVVWNTVSVSYRQRIIPNRLLGRVNSIYRLFAWGMMPIGLLLSGVLVNASQALLERHLALTVPFHAAAFGSLLLIVVGWRKLSRGFASNR